MNARLCAIELGSARSADQHLTDLDIGAPFKRFGK